MKRSLLFLALLLSVGFNLGLLVAKIDFDRTPPAPPKEEARANEGGKARPPARRPDEFVKLADHLGLSEEQRGPFLQIHRQLSTALREALPELERRRRFVYREMLAPHPEQERLLDNIDRLAALQKRVDRRLAVATLEARSLLSERQGEIYRRYLARRLKASRMWRGG